MRISKFLAGVGIASRRESEKLILAKRIKVNGKIVSNFSYQVSHEDRVLFDDKPVPKIQKPRIWKYYKPTGLITTTKDDKNRPTVFANLPKHLPKVVSVGRLDINSEGLLILTNNGDLKRFLELPANGFKRTYRVRVRGTPTEEKLTPLLQGISIDGDKFSPMDITIDTVNKSNAWLTISLKEGKNREIRRALNHVHLEVNRLLRISYGSINLIPLRKNEVQEINLMTFVDDLLQLGFKQKDLPFELPITPRLATRKSKPKRIPKRIKRHG